MTNADQTNPFTKRKIDKLSRRSFAKGMFATGMALAVAPFVAPSVGNASMGAGLQATNALHELITKQLLKFNSESLIGETTLAASAQCDGSQP